ncbi:MAG TPA: TIGR00730 family Rossman fold protein [Myxococcaceae bacterium]|nr:TIGR00730 family Rossman fold protein [Myxococcaceae bacterium]
MNHALRSVCVFCGARPGARPHYLEAARTLGVTLAERGITLVYGGASVGLMGAMADAALGKGGTVVGVMPQTLVDREVAHKGLSELHVVQSMHERKALMAQKSDGFIALPGGFGTYEELFEVITWGQIGLHRKPVGLLDVAGYFEGFRHLVKNGVDEGFIPAQHADSLVIEPTPGPLLDRLLQVAPPPSGQWFDPRRT